MFVSVCILQIFMFTFFMSEGPNDLSMRSILVISTREEKRIPRFTFSLFLCPTSVQSSLGAVFNNSLSLPPPSLSSPRSCSSFFPECKCVLCLPLIQSKGDPRLEVSSGEQISGAISSLSFSKSQRSNVPLC